MAGKLRKADFQIEISDQMKQDTEALIARLKTDRAVLALFEKNGIPLSLIEEKPWTVERWRKAYEPCMHCTGLKNCGQKQKGYYMELRYDEFLQETITACRYQRDVNRKEKHLANYLINDLPDTMRTITFGSIDPEGEDGEYLKLTAQLMQASEKGEGIYLYGSMGSGKTYLAACACNEHAKKGESVCFVHYPTFIARLTSAMKDGEYKRELNRAMFCDFLVLDDIGAESVTEWNRDTILLPLLNHRYEAGLTTWFTSNCDIPALRVHFTFSNKQREDETKARRILERIVHMSSAKPLTGKDRR